MQAALNTPTAGFSTGAIAQLLSEARVVRKQLRASRLYGECSIRDAVELAADNMRQIADERRRDRASINGRAAELDSMRG